MPQTTKASAWPWARATAVTLSAGLAVLLFLVPAAGSTGSRRNAIRYSATSCRVRHRLRGSQDLRRQDSLAWRFGRTSGVSAIGTPGAWRSDPQRLRHARGCRGFLSRRLLFQSEARAAHALAWDGSFAGRRSRNRLARVVCRCVGSRIATEPTNLAVHKRLRRSDRYGIGIS